MPKITALPAMTTADDDDLIAVVDDSTSTTRKLSLAGLRTWLQSIASWITTAMIADDAVTPDKLSPLYAASNLSASQTITSATFADTNLTLTLPTIGTWVIEASIRLVTSNNADWGEFQIYNSTDAVDADSINGESDWISGLINSSLAQLPSTRTVVCVTTDANTVIKLRGRRGTANNIALTSDTNGRSSLTAFRIG